MSRIVGVYVFVSDFPLHIKTPPLPAISYGVMEGGVSRGGVEARARSMFEQIAKDLNFLDLGPTPARGALALDILKAAKGSGSYLLDDAPRVARERYEAMRRAIEILEGA